LAGLVCAAAQGDPGPRQRHLEVLKTRGQEHVAGRHSFKFAAGGLLLFPHLRPKPITPPRVERQAFLGVAGFDQLFADGVPATCAGRLAHPLAQRGQYQPKGAA